MLLLWLATAQASEHTFGQGDFLIERSAISVGVRRAVVPEVPATPVPTEQDRICRVSLRWDREVIAEAVGCHPSVVQAAEDAVEQWGLTLTPTPQVPLDLLVVWFRFPAPPAEDGTTDSLQQVEYGVSAAPGTEIVALPPDVRPATPPRPTTRVAVRVPSDAPPDLETRCGLRVAVGDDGVPFNIAFGDCDDRAVGPIRQAVLDWRFEPATFGGVPVRANFPLRVAWAGGVAAFESVNTADSDLRYYVANPDTREDEQPVEKYVPPPLPDHPPVLVLHHPNYAPVEIYELPLPPPAAGPGVCAVTVQVRKDRRTTAWAGEPCDASVRDASVGAIASWVVDPSENRQPNEIYARFVVTFRYGDDGAPRVVVDDRDLVTAPGRPLPPSVGTFTPPQLLKQEPPRPVDGAKGECRLRVALDPAGKPDDVEPIECPPELADSAIRAVSRWRWSPPTIDGQRVGTSTDVMVRFR